MRTENPFALQTDNISEGVTEICVDISQLFEISQRLCHGNRYLVYL